MTATRCGGGRDRIRMDVGLMIGRAWGIGRRGHNDGLILLVAPNENLKAEGIDVPGKISVMGLGNTALAELSVPRLTTIEMNFALAGQEA